MATEWQKVKLGEISNKIQTGSFGSQMKEEWDKKMNSMIKKMKN